MIEDKIDTIYAPATAPGAAGVAVVRVSGPAARAVFEGLTGQALPPPRQMVNVTIRDQDRVLDKALGVYFKAPKSFTGEDVIEFHLHGGVAVMASVLSALAKQESVRLAEPGEFTRRAFENGKLDLTAAEAIGDLIAAETEAQQTLALDQLGGALSALYHGWAARLTAALAHQEADIEFPDEDMPTGVSDAVRPEIEALQNEITVHLNDNHIGERLRDGISIAVVGAPNAGKSSLVNALAKRDVAIVSEHAGTTRDIIEVHLNVGGYPVVVVDTAGLRAADNEIEAEGIRRARKRAEEADFKLALFDATQDKDAETQSLIDAQTITVMTKCDLATSPEFKEGVLLSTVTGEGLDKLIDILQTKTQTEFRKPSGPLLTRARHRAALEEAASALKRSCEAALPELTAEDLRLAIRALGRITGKVDVEDLLDVIFRDFCIGK